MDHAPGRRRFLASALVFCAAGRAGAAATTGLIRPRRLRPGDLVGLVAAGGAMDDRHVERAVRNIESLGLRVKTGANIRLQRANYAGTPYQQVSDLHEMFADREVKAVWSGRGGSGCSLLLPLLDYRLIRANPKVFVGFSDTTALHLAILRHAGLVTFHGPAAISTFSDYSVRYLKAAFMDGASPYTIAGAEPGAKTLVGGVATGHLVGGNLSVMTSLVGTPYAARLKGAIAFFEDINEAPYRVNRMLAQLAQSGELGQAAGVMIGDCRKCVTPPDEPSLSLEETYRDRIEPLGVPAAMGLTFGHVPRHFTIPLGVRARFDADAHTLTILEPPVS